MAKFCTRCGKALDLCDCKSADSVDLLDIFENEIVPCEGEKKIKAYHISQLRTRFLRRVIADGVLIVTNLRIIYRTAQTKKSKEFIHSEVPLDDVSGIAIKKGRYVDLLASIFGFFLTLALIFIPRMLGAFGSTSAVVVFWLIVFFVLVLVYVIKYRKFSGATLIEYLKSIIWLVNPVRPLISIKVISKGGVQGGVDIVTSQRGRDCSAENAPLEDVFVVSSEIGYVINGLQKGYYNEEF